MEIPGSVTAPILRTGDSHVNLRPCPLVLTYAMIRRRLPSRCSPHTEAWIENQNALPCKNRRADHSTPAALPRPRCGARASRRLDTRKTRCRKQLVASYLESRRRHSIWYQLDEGDGDIATFFHYLGLASRKAAPRFKTPLPHLTPEYLPGLPTFTRRFFEQFYERLSPRSVIVFDNYHEVPLTSMFHKVHEAGLSQLPSGMNIIMVSRTGPPPTFARLQMLARFDEDALALQADESKAIVRLHGETRGCGPSQWNSRSCMTRPMAGWLILLLQQGKHFASAG